MRTVAAPLLHCCSASVLERRRRRWSSDDAPAIDRFVAAEIRRQNVSPSRFILTGFSYGGERAFEVASRSAHPWATIWAVDPALQRLPPVPGADVRVCVHHGQAQPGAENMPAFAKTLGLVAREAPADDRRVLRAVDFNHPDTRRPAYAEALMYEWLLR